MQFKIDKNTYVMKTKMQFKINKNTYVSMVF
jgi:hypothetical protein